MAPTKNVTDLTQKVVKKRVRKAKPVKPPLKTPTSITVKIANLGSKPPKITRKVTYQRKIELANEVALEQLTKSPDDSPNNIPSTVAALANTTLLTTKPIETPEFAKINSTPRRTRKSTAKLASEESGSDNTPLAKKVAHTLSKRNRKPSLKASDTEASRSPFKSPAKSEYVNDVPSNESEPESLPVPIKKPGPKSRTTDPFLNKNKIVKPPSAKWKNVNDAPSNESEPEPLPDPDVKKPGPKSRTVAPLITEKKIVKPASVTKAKSRPGRKQQQKVTSDYFSNGTVNGEPIVKPEDISEAPVKRVIKRKQTPKKSETETKDPNTIEGTPAKKPKGTPRTKFVDERSQSTNNIKVTKASKKGKCMNSKEIKTAASMLENALGNRAALVQTRSNSINSTNSNLSWTRDISTASSLTSGTTTCVTVSSTDFVRFDKKLPFVQLENTNIDILNITEKGTEKKLLESDSSSSDSDSESSDTSSDSELNVGSKSELNLSTSSLTSKSPRTEGARDNTELLCLEMDKLTNSLKNFYTEMGKWMVCDTDDSDTFSAILEAMDLEKDVIRNCENFNNILDTVMCAKKASPKKPNADIASGNAESNREDAEFSRKDSEDGNPSQIDLKQTDVEFSEQSSIKNRDKFPLTINPPAVTANLTTDKSSPEKSPGSFETFTSDNYNYMSFDDKNCEDEDALSLYAESITGMASSRRTSVASMSNTSYQEPLVSKPTPRLQEAYIPKPTRPWVLERYTYKPTRIDERQTKSDDIPLKTIEPKMIERQSADSSSISKETNLNEKTVDMFRGANHLSSVPEGSVKATHIEQPKKQRMFAHYQPVNAVKSALYRGHCFFNLASQCKNMHNCRFTHENIDLNVLKCRLAVLTEDSLIEEYILTCKFNSLRRKYGLLFIQECKRRKSTRILMEMAIDLGLGVIEWEDNNLIVNALETTLLHLNTISFDACDDLLLFEHNGRMMCDALLSCMADSQNFSQFKRAFVKLANFMAQIKRPVDIEVVGSILERVCILPCEDSLARGMLCLMKNTDTRIFENNMTKSFEVQLSNIESDVHEAYLIAKKAAIEAQLELRAIPASDTAGQGSTPCGRDGPRHPSPDTTNLDSLKKAQMAQTTTFKRTIGTEAIRDLFKSPTNPAPKQRFVIPKVAQWRRGRYPIQSGRQHNTRMPTGRCVYRTTTNHRNEANS